jgi:ribose/xylose/arabinose/galactoside ABC-type transport system permease subunit
MSGSASVVRVVRTVVGQRFFAVLVLLVLLVGAFTVTQERFFTSPNIKALLTSAAILWVVSIGLTFVMLAGGFDLSIGSMVALSSIALGSFVNDLGVPPALAIVMALAFGALLGGGVNGVLVGPLGLSFLVVTLGTLILFRGVSNLWSDTRTTQVVSPLLDARRPANRRPARPPHPSCPAAQWPRSDCRLHWTNSAAARPRDRSSQPALPG